METWHTVLVAASVGLAAILTVLLSGVKDLLSEWFTRCVKRLRHKTYVQKIEKVATFLETLQRSRDVTKVDRYLVYHGRNCGGLPCPGKPYTVAAIHGWARDGSDPLQRYGFDQQVDLHYVKMLGDMMACGHSEQVTERMPEGAKLKQYFIDEGTKHARLFYLGLVDKELIYVCFASYGETFGVADLIKLTVITDRMRSLLETE